MNVNELKKIKSISDENIKGKTILLRVDFNTTLEFGKVIRSPKIIQHMKTVRILCEQGAKVVVLSHQGRKGEKDFVSLSNHFELLKQFTFDSVKKFEFASWQENYLKKIKELKEGEALLLENTRFLDIETAKIPIEEMAANPIIKGLADTADLFVLDALSVAHRPHATVVAFTKLLPSFAGPYLKEEIDALVKLEEMAGKTKTCLVLGGAKPEEPIAIMKKMLSENKVEHVLLGGLLGEIALQAKGLRLGKTDEFLKQKGFDKFIPEFKELFSLYGKKIHLPVDVAIEKRAVRREIPVTDLPSEHPIYDVGHHTITNYCDLLDECDLIIHNGPFGVYEATQFRVGTREILETIHHCKGFSLVGGGDTVTALVGIGYRKSDFGHVSLAGGALLEYLAGSDLPGLKALMTD